jgi:predicted RNA polymerase sigma factor
MRECLRRNKPGAYQLQAAIQAVRADLLRRVGRNEDAARAYDAAIARAENAREKD